MKSYLILSIGLLFSVSACQKASIPMAQLPAVSPVAPEQSAPQTSDVQAAATHTAPDPVTPTTTHTQASVSVPETEAALLADAREGAAAVAAFPTPRVSLVPQSSILPEQSLLKKDVQQDQRAARRAASKMAKPKQGKSSKAARKAQALSGLQIGGIVLASVGLLVFLGVSWLFGLLMMGGGVLMILLGKGNSGGGRVRNNSNNNNNGGEIQDVVYLKNGSIIRGMIVEQIPNQSLKIRTNDGNVFVYEMTEVTKITKE